MQNPQLQAMEHLFANDWNNRVVIETEGIDISENIWRFESAKSVLALLGHNSSGRQDARTFVEKLQDCFSAPVLQNVRFHRKGLLSSSLNRKYWRAGNSVIMNLGSTADGGQYAEMFQSTDFTFLLKAKGLLQNL